MGNKQAKPKHMLHYHRMDENCLWVFYPENEQYMCYPVNSQAGPFFFGSLETVSVPSMNSIFVIGGSELSRMPDYSFREDPLNAVLGEGGLEVNGKKLVRFYSFSSLSRRLFLTLGWQRRHKQEGGRPEIRCSNEGGRAPAADFVGRSDQDRRQSSYLELF